MKYTDIKNFNERCDTHPDHQTGMISNGMIQQRLSAEITELREYIRQRLNSKLTWSDLTAADWQNVANKKGTSLNTFTQGVIWAGNRLKEINNLKDR